MVVHPFPRTATALALASLLALSASVTLGQEDEVALETDSPVFMPATVAGQPLEVTITSGEALLETMDPENPEHVQQLEELNALLDGVGSSLDRFHIASGQLVTEEDGVLVIAMRVEGADIGAEVEPWLDFLSRGFFEEPELTEDEVGGKLVTVVVEGDYPFDDPPRYFAYATADTIWFVGGSEEWGAELIEGLPS